MNKKIDLELNRLYQEQGELTRKLEIVASNIALLRRVCENGNGEENLPALAVAVTEAMKGLRRFTRTELAARVKQMYPLMDFSERSVVKPMKQCEAKGEIKMVQRSQGNKRQAVYEWTVEE